MNKKKNFFSIFRYLLGEKKKKSSIEDYLQSTKVKFLSSRLQELMSEKKPYLRQRYSIKDMATDIQVPAYQLSAFLNHVMQMNFSDYLNKFRVEYCEDLMKRNIAGTKTLKELAQKCGFNNRNTFTTAFKKFTGKTPSDYARHR